MTHYTSDPSWEGGKEVYLWSPRGRRVVRREQCTTVKVNTKTLVRNPIRLDLVSEVGQDGVEDVEGASRKRKISTTQSASHLDRSEYKQRMEAYTRMVDQGRLEGLNVEVNYSKSVSCHHTDCDHIREEDDTCTKLFSSQTKLPVITKLWEL